MKHLLFICFVTVLSLKGWTQELNFTPIGHCHNDYRLRFPLTTAIESGMRSIEADVFLIKGELYVAHYPFQIKRKRTLDKLYLEPIAELISQGKALPITLMIDVKYRAKASLNKIIEQLSQYPYIFNDKSLVTIIISGSRPPKEDWANYPSFIYFDGRPDEVYTEAQRKRIGMISVNFQHYKPNWEKHDTGDKKNLKNVVESCHARGEKIRFWNAPDNKSVWQRLVELGVDIINTDNPVKLNLFFQKANPTVTE